MKIHCIRHEPFEGLACIHNWIIQNRHDLSFTYTYMQQSFPSKCDFDFLIIMGGTASIYESLDEHWYKDEKNFLEKCLNRNKKVLGICLGSQILADLLGSRVFCASEKEIGWYPVTFHTRQDPKWMFMPDEIITFHWHGDTFDLPRGAVHLASSVLTPNQGFIYGDQILALQFHPEMTRDSMEKIIRVAGTELLKGGDFVQPADQILKEKSLIAENNALMFEILDHFAGSPK